MIFKKNALFSLALAVLCTAQVYPLEMPEPATAKKRTFVYHVGKKLNINVRDIAQGAIIGGILFGSSFLAEDPKLKLILRTLACAPMIAGIFAPHKILKKLSDLELDEARCSNFKCTGVCSNCRITKSYIAASLIMIPLYGIMWMFKKPAAPVIGDNPTTPPANPEPTAPLAHTPESKLATQASDAPTHDAVLPPQEQPAATNLAEPIVKNEALKAGVESLPIVDPADAQAPIPAQAPLEPQAREAADPKEEPSARQDAPDGIGFEAPQAAQELQAREATERTAVTPAAQDPISEEEAPGLMDLLGLTPADDQTTEEPSAQSGWSTWLTDKAVEWLAPNDSE